MNPEEIELHDAVIKSTRIDYEKNIVTVELEYYPDGQSSKSRISGKITFSGVSHCSGISNLTELKDNASSGNISYWVPSTDGGTTYLYLTGGFIEVTAKKLTFESTAN
jgi:hypothetical protein